MKTSHTDCPTAPPVADTLMIPLPSVSKCPHPQSLFGTDNTNALRLNVYCPCQLLCMEALTHTWLGINRASAAGGDVGQSVGEVLGNN